MEIVPVNNPQDTREFLNVVELIYKDDKHYVRPLDVQIQEIFDPSSNDFFKHGQAQRFILKDDKGRTIGRVSAFINDKKAHGFTQPTGGLGFFECIDHQEAAFMLFDCAKEWLAERGMQAMDGPINFGENDNFWGLLIEGFTPCAFGMQYNPPYYQAFFEAYGFSSYFEQVTNHLDLQKPFPERFWSIARRVVSRPDYTFKHFRRKDAEQFIIDFAEVYNDAWQYHDNFTPMDPDTLRKSIREADAFMDEELIWFVYHKEEPIAFLVMYPDVNQILRHFNGQMNWINKIKFLYYKWRHEMTRARVVIMGVKTRYQRLGIESGIFYNLREVVAKKPYLKELELSWVGDFNPKMRALHDSMGAQLGKRHITYRYIFDPARRQAQRAGSIPLDTKYLKEA